MSICLVNYNAYLMVMMLTVRQSFTLIMAMTQEWFLTDGTDKVLRKGSFEDIHENVKNYRNMPILPQGSDDPLLDGPMTGTADRNTHRVVTSQTIQLAAHFAGIRC